MNTVQQPFKFRYVNTLAGAFTLICLALMMAGVFLAGRAQGWFETRMRLVADLTTEEGAYGLQEGAEIRILDALAGRVIRIEPSEAGILQAELNIRQRFAGFINRGSTALVKRMVVGLAGDAYIEIQPGKPGFEPFESGDRIAIAKDVEIIETILQILDEVQVVVIPLVAEVHGILENINRITRAIDDGEGLLGMLVRDEAAADEIRGTLAAVRETADHLPAVAGQSQDTLRQVQGMLTELQAVSVNAREISETAGGMVSELAAETAAVRGLIFEATETLHELGVVLRGLRNHWLLRNHVDTVPRLPLPIPSDIGAAGQGGNEP